MGQSCCGASGDERKLDSARLKHDCAVNFKHGNTPRRSETEISDQRPDLDTDRALKEILNDGTEVPVANGHTVA